VKHLLLQDLPREDVTYILDVFRADIRRLMDVLRQGAASGDTGAFARAAHSLTGAAAAVGAEALERSARIAMREAEARPGRRILHAALRGVAHDAEDTLLKLSKLIGLPH
jgi:HPt (histidine-containing phosphotransfer) domain-containing protein